MVQLNWKIGVEVELMAPSGLSRQDLAESIAKAHNAEVYRIFHPQSEPSKVPGTPIFENLTLGFEVIDSEDNLISRCVDDLTLQDDLDKSQSSKPGWYRVVSDDSRLLELVICNSSAVSPQSEVLKPIASLFVTPLEIGPGGMVRVVDNNDNPIAIATSLPGERERPCELITPPMERDHLQSLEALLSIARSLGFTIAAEGATHIHFDGKSLCNARIFANLVNLLWTYGDILKQLVGTNSKCRRLGSWDATLLETVNQSYFCELPWEEAKVHLVKSQPTKYCDFNLKNIIYGIPDKFTFEARIFPGWIDAQSILQAAALMEAILNYVQEVEKILPSEPLIWDLVIVQDFLKSLPMSGDIQEVWQSRAESFV
ncbi:MAG: amidoligase family protein [Cyanobacteria bacterium P01_A01_bin.45]